MKYLFFWHLKLMFLYGKEAGIICGNAAILYFTMQTQVAGEVALGWVFYFAVPFALGQLDSPANDFCRKLTLTLLLLPGQVSAV